VPEHLSDFLSTLSSAADADAVVRDGVVHARRALAADVVAMVCRSDLVARAGRVAQEVSDAELLDASAGSQDRVQLPGLGVPTVVVSPVEQGSDIRLVAVRDAADPFTDEERCLLADMAAGLALVWGVDRSDEDGQPTDSAEPALDEPDGAQRALRNSEQRLRDILQGAPNAFLAVDAEGLILEWNVEAEATFGWPRSEAIGRRFADTIVPPGEREGFDADVQAFVAGADEAGQHHPVELAALHRDGHEVPVELRLSRLRAGGTYIIQTFVRDMSESVRVERERREAEARIAHMTLHDPLTGLPNRALLFDRLAHALAGAKRRGATVAVLFADLDNFRLVNESLGHQAGDDMLVELARRLGELTRRSDTMARIRQDTLVRFGGDEFVIVCEDIGSERDATAIADRIAAALSDASALAGEQIVVTASIGIALAAGDASPDAVVNEAEAAMHHAKERGRARYELFDPAIGERVFNRLHQESELRQAIEQRQLRLFYQPIVSVADGGLVGAEALVRWEHPERGLLAPAQFLSLAEETGMIVPLGRWVLQEACAQASRWQANRRCGLFFHISVNVSAHQLANNELSPLVTEVLAATELDPARLVLEITESVLLEEGRISVDLLGELRALGVRVSLDDFGSGYSSLSYLRRLPLDAVKLDRAFISALAETAVDRQIVAAIVQMARALSMTVVAEGVETVAQWACLRELGCHLAQGYYFARPMPAAQMTSLVEDASARGGLLRVAGALAAAE